MMYYKQLVSDERKYDQCQIQPMVKRIYSHISKEKKNQLIQTVLRQKCKIKKIAQDLKINYATAKTIIHNYKKKNVSHQPQSQKKQANYKSVTTNSKINLVITLNNTLISSRVYQMTPVIKNFTKQ